MDILLGRIDDIECLLELTLHHLPELQILLDLHLDLELYQILYKLIQPVTILALTQHSEIVLQLFQSIQCPVVAFSKFSKSFDISYITVFIFGHALSTAHQKKNNTQSNMVEFVLKYFEKLIIILFVKTQPVGHHNHFFEHCRTLEHRTSSDHFLYRSIKTSFIMVFLATTLHFLQILDIDPLKQLQDLLDHLIQIVSIEFLLIHYKDRLVIMNFVNIFYIFLDLSPQSEHIHTYHHLTISTGYLSNHFLKVYFQIHHIQLLTSQIESEHTWRIVQHQYEMLFDRTEVQ